MHILTVADFFYPGVTGGASIVVYEVMRRLVQRGHTVTALIRQQAGTPDCIEGMQVFSYAPPERELFYPLAVKRCVASLHQLLKDRPFDLINMHHAFSGLAVELVRRRPPSAFFFHGPWYREALANAGMLGWKEEGRLPLPFRLRRGADRFILQRCDRVVGLSDYMRGEAEQIFSGTSGKFTKIPGGVDAKRFRLPEDRAKLRRQLGLPEDGRILLTVRRLSPRMGLENLVRAMAKVEQEREDTVLLIGGIGELRDPLEQLIAELGLKRTRLLGYIDDSDLASYYQVSDLFIMPSVALEGFGLSTLEALACGLPVLGTPIGGTPEILRQITPEFILPRVDPDAIASGILEHIAHLPDRALSLQVRSFAEGFDWEQIVDAVEELFLGLCRNK
jgi:glycosyltransferase involved in cell wall biosynthesis